VPSRSDQIDSATASISVEEENLCPSPVRPAGSNRRIRTGFFLEHKMMKALPNALLRTGGGAVIALTNDIVVVLMGWLREKLTYWIWFRAILWYVHNMTVQRNPCR
jgi:hypothetical protein